MCSMFGMRSLSGERGGGGVTRSICDPNGWINIGGSATTADAKKSPRIEDFSIAAPALLCACTYVDESICGIERQ